MSLNGFFDQQPRIVLAPMEGVVDSVMREVLTAIGGIDLCVTEFIRVTDRLLPEKEFFRYAPELRHGCRTKAGTPVLIQLLGGQPGPIAENAALACELGAIGIDLNFGCPAKTVNRHDGGATLLKNPDRLYKIVEAVRLAIPAEITVSAKVRLGFDDKEKHLDIARAVAAGGASWLTVHARTRNEGYKPPAHWEYIGFMRSCVQVPVIANGEIWTLEDAERARLVSGCQHLMLGRGLIAHPGLAHEIQSGRSANLALAPLVRELAEKSQKARNDHFAVCRTKQWLRSLGRNHSWALKAFELIKLDTDFDIISHKLFPSPSLN